MALLPFEAQTDIERQIVKARDEGLSGDVLMSQIADTILYIPSTAEVQTDGRGFTPVLMDQDGAPLVIVFTAKSRQPREMADYMVQMNGRQFFLRLPAGYGVVFNPGYDAQMLLPPHGAAALKDDLRGG